MKWISVKDELPKIPEGKYGVSVLVVEFDSIYEEINPGHGQSVYEVIYGFIEGRNPVYDKGFDHPLFITLASGPSGTEWVPCMDEITHWMYLPEPPMKQKQPNDKIVESLENLRDELAIHSDTRSREIWFKINSCLYSEYPHTNKD